MNEYRDYVSQQLAPSWLQGPYGLAWFRAIGGALDLLIDRMRQAVRQRFPSKASPEGVGAAGVDRGMERGPGEALSAYRSRLDRAWDIWPYAGTAWGLLTALESSGFTGAKLEIVQGKQYGLNAAGALVITDLSSGSWLVDPVGSTFWSKFVVIFPTPFPTILAGPPASSSATANSLRRLISAWKPAHATCAGIYFLPAGTAWGYPPTDVWGTGTWGDDGTITVWSP